MKAKILIDGERNAEIKLYPTNRFEKDKENDNFQYCGA